MFQPQCCLFSLQREQNHLCGLPKFFRIAIFLVMTSLGIGDPFCTLWYQTGTQRLKSSSLSLRISLQIYETFIFLAFTLVQYNPALLSERIEIYAHQLTYFPFSHAFPFAKSQVLDSSKEKAVSTQKDECKVHVKSFSSPSVFFFSFVTQSIRECQYSHLYMIDTQIYRNFLTPQTSNEISSGGFLKFSVLVERTATIT